MDWQELIFLSPYLMSFAISLGVGLYTWQRSSVTGATAFTIVTLAQSAWALGFIFELISPAIEAKVFWDDAQFAAGFVLLIGYMVFAFEYTGHQLAHPKRVWVALSILPAILMMLVVTNRWHHLARASVWLAPREPFPELLYDFTPLVLAISAYIYGLMLVSVAMLAGHLVRQHRLYRIQTGIIIIGCLIPLISTMLTLAGISFGPYRDMFPITSAIGNVIIAWGLFRYGIFDILPVAREVVVENMTDMVAVLDAHNRVVDANPALLKGIHRSASETIGRTAAIVFSTWPNLVEQYQPVEAVQAEIEVGFPDGPRYFDLRVSPLPDRVGRTTGRIVVVREATERKQTEAALRRSRDELEQRVQERTLELSTAVAALRASEELYRHAIEAAGAVPYYRDHRANAYSFMGEGILQMTGYAAAELTPALWDSLEQERFPRGKMAHLSYTEAQRQTRDGLIRQWECDYRIHTRDGQSRWVADSAVQIRDEKNVRIGVIGILQDISERKQAEDVLQRYTARLELLREIDQAILSARSPEETATAALIRLRRLIPCVRASVNLFDLATSESVLLAVSVNVSTYLGPGGRIPIDDFGPIAHLRQGQHLVINNVAALASRTISQERLLAEGVKAWLHMPLVNRGELIGSLNFGAGEPGAFTTEHIQIAGEAANQIAVAIQNTRLFMETAEALAREQRLNEVVRIISSSLDLPTTLSNIVRLVVELAGAECGVIGLIAPDGQSLTHPYLFNLPQGLDLEQPIPKDQGIAWRVIETRQAVCLVDYSIHPSALPRWVAAGVRGFMEVPIVAGEACLGILGLYQLNLGKHFSDRDLALAESVGRQAGIAIHNAQLFDAERRRVALLTALHETGLDLSTQLELPILLRTIMERAARLVEAPMGGVYLLQPDGQTLQPVANLPAEDVSSSVRMGEGLVGRVAQNVAPIIVDDYRLWPDRLSDDVSFCAVASVPIVWQGQVLGVISLCDTRSARFGQGDVTAVRLLAAQAAVAIVNARLLADAQRQLKELTLLHSVVIAVVEANDEDELIAQVAQIIDAHFAADILDVFLINTTANELQHHPATRVAGREALPDKVPLGQGITGTVAVSGQSWRISDVLIEPAYIAANPNIRSELAVPLKVGEQTLGVLNLECVQLSAFSEADERLLLTIAGQLATAIERLRATAQIQNLNAELEKRVQERTAQLEAANRELESFSYSVSHDLRAPLRSVAGFSRILMEQYAGSLDPEIARHIKRIRDGAQQMSDLIDDLLALSRLGRQALRLQLLRSADLTALVQKIVDDLQAEDPDREVAVTIGRLSDCTADLTLLRQVWANLIANAWKYTGPRDRAHIEIGSKSTPMGMAYYVRDNGVGFDMRFSDKLFGAFQRLHSADEFEGTGVGLAIVQRIIDRHGGQIWAEAEIDKGATFFFTAGMV